jgi:hypothetical protein
VKVDCVFARNDISDGGSGGLAGGLLSLRRHFWRELESRLFESTRSFLLEVDVLGRCRDLSCKVLVVDFENN